MGTGTRLVVGGVLVAATTLAMAWLGASESWQYYMTADECLRQGPTLVGRRLRVSGTIVEGSLLRETARPAARFALQAAAGELAVDYRGSLPDSLATQRAVVVEGRLVSEGRLLGNRLFTRCASKYERKRGDILPERPPIGTRQGE